MKNECIECGELIHDDMDICEECLANPVYEEDPYTEIVKENMQSCNLKESNN